MSRFHVSEPLLADSSPTPTATFPDDSIYESSDVPPDTTYDCYPSPFQPQIETTRADEVQTNYHVSWASTVSVPEVIPPSVFGTERNFTFPYILVCRMSRRKTRSRRGPGFLASFGGPGKSLPGPFRSFLAIVSSSFEC